MNEVLSRLLSPGFVAGLVIAAATVALYIFIRRARDHYQKKLDPSADGQRSAAARITFGIAKFAVLLIGVLAILQVNGINVTALVAGLGIASAIVGLALQDFLKDIIAGINILSEHFYTVGECLEYQGKEGVVIAISLRTTKLEDLDDHSVTTVCNRNISEAHRLSDSLEIDLPLSYREELKEVFSSLMPALCARITALEHVEACSFEGTQKYGESAIFYRFIVRCAPTFRTGVRRAAQSEILLALSERGIAIPFNQLDVHFDAETEKRA